MVAVHERPPDRRRGALPDGAGPAEVRELAADDGDGKRDKQRDQQPAEQPARKYPYAICRRVPPGGSRARYLTVSVPVSSVPWKSQWNA